MGRTCSGVTRGEGSERRSLRQRCGAQALGELLWGHDGEGTGTGSCSGGRGARVWGGRCGGAGRAWAMEKGAAEPLTPRSMSPWVLVSPVLGLSPCPRVSPAPPDPRASWARLAKSHAAPTRVSVRSLHNPGAAHGRPRLKEQPRVSLGAAGAGWGAGVARGHRVGLYPHSGAGARGEGHGGAAVIVQVHHGVGAGHQAGEGRARLPLPETLDVALRGRGGRREGQGALLLACSIPRRPSPP